MASGRVPKLMLRQERAAFMRGRQRLQDRVADQITAFSGSMAFVYIHVVWFAVWRIGTWSGGVSTRFRAEHATAKERIAQSKALANGNS
jgi:uncharacterized membrane protein